MGIASLLPFIDSAAAPAHLHQFRGQTAAIDGYAWLHRGAKTCALEMVRGTFTTKFVDFCLGQVRLLRANGVEPFVVLDGARLPAKAGGRAGAHPTAPVGVCDDLHRVARRAPSCSQAFSGLCMELYRSRGDKS